MPYTAEERVAWYESLIARVVQDGGVGHLSVTLQNDLSTAYDQISDKGGNDG